jgi:hypothetical protein
MVQTCGADVTSNLWAVLFFVDGITFQQRRIPEYVATLTFLHFSVAGKKSMVMN